MLKRDGKPIWVWVWAGAAVFATAAIVAVVVAIHANQTRKIRELDTQIRITSALTMVVTAILEDRRLRSADIPTILRDVGIDTTSVDRRVRSDGSVVLFCRATGRPIYVDTDTEKWRHPSSATNSIAVYSWFDPRDGPRLIGVHFNFDHDDAPLRDLLDVLDRRENYSPGGGLAAPYEERSGDVRSSVRIA